MALIDITPKMTSNTAPSPYVVSASSENTTYKAYKAFNGTLTDSSDAWYTVGGVPLAWIKIDMSYQIRIDAFSIFARNDSANTSCPNTFILYGSNDNTSFTQISYISNQSLWGVSEGRLFMLSSPASFRYYRINIISNNGNASVTTIGEIKFWQDDGVIPTVTNKSFSLNYCLPKNSTRNLEQRENDNREGMLAYANDTDNYGTLHMVNKIGQFEIPKAKTKQDIIFSGSVSGYSNVTIGEGYNLNDYGLFIITNNGANSICTQSELSSFTGTITRIIGLY